MSKLVSILVLSATISIAALHKPNQKKSEYIEVGYYNTTNPEEGEAFIMHKSGERYIKALDKDERIVLSSVRKYIYESVKIDLINSSFYAQRSNKQNGINRYISMGNGDSEQTYEWAIGSCNDHKLLAYYEDFVKEFRIAFAKEYDN
ncbi:MAG: hypothetical protein JXR19_06960 [Bacteroidia bacterium]